MKMANSAQIKLTPTQIDIELVTVVPQATQRRSHPPLSSEINPSSLMGGLQRFVFAIAAPPANFPSIIWQLNRHSSESEIIALLRWFFVNTLGVK